MGKWFVLFLIISFCLFVIMVVSAPKGYQDKNGFHYGEPEDKFKEDEWT